MLRIKENLLIFLSNFKRKTKGKSIAPNKIATFQLRNKRTHISEEYREQAL